MSVDPSQTRYFAEMFGARIGNISAVQTKFLQVLQRLKMHKPRFCHVRIVNVQLLKLSQR